MDGQRAVRQRVLRRVQRRVTNASAMRLYEKFSQVKRLAMQNELATHHLHISPAAQFGAHLGIALLNRHMQINRVDPPGRRGVILEINCLRGVGAHGRFLN